MVRRRLQTLGRYGEGEVIAAERGAAVLKIAQRLPIGAQLIEGGRRRSLVAQPCKVVLSKLPLHARGLEIVPPACEVVGRRFQPVDGDPEGEVIRPHRRASPLHRTDDQNVREQAVKLADRRLPRPKAVFRPINHAVNRNRTFDAWRVRWRSCRRISVGGDRGHARPRPRSYRKRDGISAILSR